MSTSKSDSLPKPSEKTVEKLTDTIFFPQIFEVNETLRLSQLRSNNPESVNDYLLSTIKKKIGGKCLDIGLVDAQSIKILGRTLGNINTSHFNGEVYYHVRCQANVCRPVEGTILKVKVSEKNEIGLFCVSGPLHIIVPPIYMNRPELMESIQVGQMIMIEIVNYLFQLNDDHIRVIAKYVMSV